jgi:putative transcriptional regulator
MSNIKTIRKRLGLTQAALAVAIGCSQGNIGHYEIKGQTMPPNVAKRLISYAFSLGCAITYEDIYGAPEVNCCAESTHNTQEVAYISAEARRV